MKEIQMTQAEISRADILSKIGQKKLTQRKAAEMLGLCERHVRRLYNRFQRIGLTSVVSQKRGKPSNHQLSKSLKARISELITIELYSGFGPTFMREKLQELHNIKASIETTRQIMIQNGVWEAHKKKCPVIHQQRKRRARCGELVQIDGSPHAWFENRGEPCVLISFVDDATGRTYGRFFHSETTKAYMIISKMYFLKYGRPLAFYCDKDSVFRINRPGCLKKEQITQFARACKELDIEIICANSASAKGRVERNHQTQQDRLIKELRIAEINSIDKANEFLDGFYWDLYNNKFAVAAASSIDAHRTLLPEHDLNKILSRKRQGKLSKNLEVQCDNVIYQVVLEKASRRLQKATVTIIKGLDGRIYIEHDGESLPFKIFSEQEAPGKIVSSKNIDTFFKEKKERKVLKNHPWKGTFHLKATKHETAV